MTRPPRGAKVQLEWRVCHVSRWGGRTRAWARLFLQKKKTRSIIANAPREEASVSRVGELGPGGAALNPALCLVRGPAGRRHVRGAGTEEGVVALQVSVQT